MGVALRWIGVALALLSMVALYEQGLVAEPFAFPLRVLIDFDDDLKRRIFQWMEPFIVQCLAAVSAWTGWKLQLFPYWKHIVVLLWLYFGGGARRAWHQGYRTGAVFRVAFGGLMAAIAGIGFGVVPPSTGAGSTIIQSLLAAIFPVAAVVTYAIGVAAWVAWAYDRNGQTWTTAFGQSAGAYPVLYGIVGGGVVALSVILSALPAWMHVFAAVPNPGLAVFFLLVTLLATFLTWSDRLLNRESNLGLLMFEALGGAAAFIVADAGWVSIQ